MRERRAGYKAKGLSSTGNPYGTHGVPPATPEPDAPEDQPHAPGFGPLQELEKKLREIK